MIKGLQKEYGTEIAINVHELYLQSGKLYCLLGPNGSGKTTLVECLAGVTSPTRGEIIYAGHKKLGEIKENISLMEQYPYLFLGSVLYNIQIGLKIRKVPYRQREELTKKYIALFDLQFPLNKKAHLLSGGQIQKICLLRTAVLETDLTLLDEPTSGMDIESTFQAENIIRKMVDNDKTVVMVTHDYYQAERVADIIIFMDKGKVIEMGQPKDILQNPQNDLIRKILNKRVRNT
ncbi:ATP-binding cassette domain-containing protein [Bacillota bacterium LX-D]|nr:ATP-binding cassette domain-containing protein [Bacillota bacterium LX-D]